MNKLWVGQRRTLRIEEKKEAKLNTHNGTRPVASWRDGISNFCLSSSLPLSFSHSLSLSF
jgi:hypothetical protein